MAFGFAFVREMLKSTLKKKARLKAQKCKLWRGKIRKPQFFLLSLHLEILTNTEKAMKNPLTRKTRT